MNIKNKSKKYAIGYSNEKDIISYRNTKKLLIGGNRIPSNMYSEMECPITFNIMNDPVICMDGHTYERSSIEDWFRISNISPKTNMPLSDLTLIPNIALRNIIESFKESRCIEASQIRGSEKKSFECEQHEFGNEVIDTQPEGIFLEPVKMYRCIKCNKIFSEKSREYINGIKN